MLPKNCKIGNFVNCCQCFVAEHPETCGVRKKFGSISNQRKRWFWSFKGKQLIFLSNKKSKKVHHQNKRTYTSKMKKCPDDICVCYESASFIQNQNFNSVLSNVIPGRSSNSLRMQIRVSVKRNENSCLKIKQISKEWMPLMPLRKIWSFGCLSLSSQGIRWKSNW